MDDEGTISGSIEEPHFEVLTCTRCSLVQNDITLGVLATGRVSTTLLFQGSYSIARGSEQRSRYLLQLI